MFNTNWTLQWPIRVTPPAAPTPLEIVESQLYDAQLAHLEAAAERERATAHENMLANRVFRLQGIAANLRAGGDLLTSTGEFSDSRPF